MIFTPLYRKWQTTFVTPEIDDRSKISIVAKLLLDKKKKKTDILDTVDGPTIVGGELGK